MIRRPGGLRSLKNKLALLIFGVTALASSVLYFLVVPQLESSLRREALRNLRVVAVASTSTLDGFRESDADPTAAQLDLEVRAIADAADARVTLFFRRPDGLFLVSDSNVTREVEVSDSLARRAARSGRVTTGTTLSDGEVMAQVARPLADRGRPPEWVVLYSSSLEGVGNAVAVVQRQILAATALALLVALAGGYWVALALARRVRRLERAAGQVAAGSFVDPLPVDSRDELGQLTRAFNEMERQLAQVDDARREFIANASHELRTPIFSLGGFVELLDDEEIDPETRKEFVRAMREQVGRLQKLAVDLLDLSRLDAGALELQSGSVDLTELARSILGEFTPAVGQHRTDLRLKLPDTGVDAYCDRERVAQIMRILLDNALLHNPEGTQVTVAAARRNGSAEFAVSDRGPEIEEERMSQLFERFYTGDTARGSGLGLAIARELAERMEGHIELRSVKGEKVFTLALPAADDEERTR